MNPLGHFPAQQAAPRAYKWGSGVCCVSIASRRHSRSNRDSSQRRQGARTPIRSSVGDTYRGSGPSINRGSGAAIFCGSGSRCRFSEAGRAMRRCDHHGRRQWQWIITKWRQQQRAGRQRRFLPAVRRPDTHSTAPQVTRFARGPFSHRGLHTLAAHIRARPGFMAVVQVVIMVASGRGEIQVAETVYAVSSMCDPRGEGICGRVRRAASPSGRSDLRACFSAVGLASRDEHRGR